MTRLKIKTYLLQFLFLFVTFPIHADIYSEAKIFSDENILQMVVEIPAGTNKKIEYDKFKNEFLINKPRPATPATAASPVFILKIALLTPLSPRFNVLNARLVLCFAFISNCNLFLAIIFSTCYHDLTYRKKHTIS